MKVKEIMTSEPRTCSRETNLAEAGALMLEGDCGILPVLADGKLVGVVTDRDLYIALATRNMRASDLTVGEVVQTPVHSCGPDDTVQAALATMKQYRVRRLAVEGFGSTVLGILSIDDIALAAGARKPVRDAEVVNTLRAIYAHHHPTPRIAAPDAPSTGTVADPAPSDRWPSPGPTV
jgi:CBS domain-containing protein